MLSKTSVPFLQNRNASSTEPCQKNVQRGTDDIPKTKLNNYAHVRVVCTRCDFSENK